MARGKAGVLFQKGKDILSEKGLLILIKRAFLFLMGCVFKYETYYIYERGLSKLDKIEFTPRIKNCTSKIISTSEQLDQLVAEGFDIGSYLDAEEIKERINRKAVLFCIFVGQELVHRSWLAFSEEAKKDIDILPYVVDFETEACLGGGETVPRYRGLGLHKYSICQRLQFVTERGLKTKFSVSKSNVIALKAHSRVGNKVVAEGRYLKLLWWKSWREKPVKEIKQ